MIIILLCISTVTATSFTATTNKNTASICPSNTLIQTFTIQNTGTQKQEYTFSESGSASSFSTIVPVGYILNPQESKTIYIYITPPKTTLPGTYDLNIIINNKQSTKELTFLTTINDCYKTSITSTTKTICVKDNVNLDFTITNNGNYDQTYTLKASSPLPSTISENQIYIPSKQSKTVSIFTQPEKKGEYEIVLQASSKDSTSSSSSFIIAEPCFDYNLLTEKNFIKLCDHTTSTIPITINNIGKENIFDLQLKGESWAKLQTTSLNIQSKQQKQTELILSPDYGTQGSFNFIITANNKEIKQQQEITANVKDCHQAELKISKNQDRICRSLSNNYNIVLKNTGEFSEQYKITSNIQWANLDKDFITLSTNQETTINLNIHPGNNIQIQQHIITIKAESVDSKITKETSINLDLISEEDCYKPYIKAERTDVNLNPDTTATIPITIENKGSETATYNLEISGTASSFTQLNPSTITVSPKKSEVIYLYIAPSSTIKDGNYILTTTARLKDSGILNSEEININIGKQFDVPIIEKEKLNLDKYSDFFKKYFLIIIILVVLILLVVLGFKSGLFAGLFESEGKKEEKPIEKKETIKEKPIKKDEKPKEEYITDYFKIIKYAVSLILIIVAIFFLIKYFSFILPYKWYILFAIIILGVILLVIKLGSIKPVIDFFEEEEPVSKKEIKKEERSIKKEKSSFLYWIIGAIVLIILIFIAWKINLFLYIFNYKLYILGAIIIIAIIILVIRYWQGITSFFEEEEGEKKEVKQKEVEEDKEKPVKKEETKKEREDYY